MVGYINTRAWQKALKKAHKLVKTHGRIPPEQKKEFYRCLDLMIRKAQDKPMPGSGVVQLFI